MTWSSSLNRWMNCTRSRSYGSVAWKDMDFRLTQWKPRSWYLGKYPYVGCRHKLHILWGCSIWANKRCSDISGTLKPDNASRCKQCTGLTRQVNGWPMAEVTVWRNESEVVPSFCYLGDCLSSGAGYELDSITRCRVAIRWTRSAPTA